MLHGKTFDRLHVVFWIEFHNDNLNCEVEEIRINSKWYLGANLLSIDAMKGDREFGQEDFPQVGV